MCRKPAAAGGVDAPADETGSEVRRTRQVPPDDTRAEELDAADATSGDVVGEAAADDLDLGQLGHDVEWGRNPVSPGWRPGRPSPPRHRN